MIVLPTDPTRPVRISNNAASQNGGGIYVGAYASSNPAASPNGSVVACAYRIDGNVAREGSAVYMDSDTSTLAVSSGGYFFGYSNCGSAPASGSVPCTLDGGCHLIDGNQTIDINNNNQPTAGAAVFGQPASLLTADRMVVRGNIGGYAIRAKSAWAS